MTQQAAHIVPLLAGDRRRARPVRRADYELARVRIAGLREPPPCLAHLARPRD